MTEETNPVSRRNVLIGLGSIGVGGALAGAGTSAYFSDDESLPDNQLVAGGLSMVVGWQEYYNGTPYDAFPDTSSTDDGVKDESYFESNACGNLIDESEPLASKRRTKERRGEPLLLLDDVKPGDGGSLELCYRLCDNDGWVWFRTVNKEYPPENGVHLVDAIRATLYYDVNDDRSKSPVVAHGSLRDVLDQLNDGTLLDAEPSSNPSEECVPLKTRSRSAIKKGAVLSFDGADGDEVEIKITRVHRTPIRKRIRGFDWRELTDHGICRIDTAGKKWSDSTPYNCVGAGSVPGRKFHQLRSVRFHYCQRAETETTCTASQETKCLRLEWDFPIEPDNDELDDWNDVQGDSLEFDMQFYAEQCRHNPDPVNPWE